MENKRKKSVNNKIIAEPGETTVVGNMMIHNATEEPITEKTLADTLEIYHDDVNNNKKEGLL